VWRLQSLSSLCGMQVAVVVTGFWGLFVLAHTLLFDLDIPLYGCLEKRVETEELEDVEQIQNNQP
jgi:hypothetical protein